MRNIAQNSVRMLLVVLFFALWSASDLWADVYVFGSSVSLRWASNPEADVCGYEVHRGTSPDGVYVKINGGVVTETTWIDTDVSPGKYYYKVRAMDLANNLGSFSSPSDAVIVSDGDLDNDGIADEADNCRVTANDDQADMDGDGIGNACDCDADGDAYESNPCGGSDCDDLDPLIYPAASEQCDGKDNNCNGYIDESCNSCPTANAGMDQDVYVGDTITLDGSASTDPDGHGLTYFWLLTSAPAGSAAILMNPASATPSLTVDVPGDYVVELVVDDGTCVSSSDAVSVSTITMCPIADAGSDQDVFVGDTVTLDGNGSSDPEGDELVYSWSLVSAPADSKATLSDSNTVTPKLPIDLPGDYVAELIVDDGTCLSDPDIVVVNTINMCPEANAGPDQAIHLGEIAVLDGSGSTDTDGDKLTYAWSLISTPADSAAALSDSTSVKPTLAIDVLGDYAAELVVNDGTCDSDPGTVVISTINVCPVANAGADFVVYVGDTVMLDGSASMDPEGDELTYMWTLMNTPANSAAILSDPGAISPIFTVDKSGDFIIRLVVNDGTCDSASDSITISTYNLPPTADAGSDLNVMTGDVVRLDSGASADPDGDTLSCLWSILSRPAGSRAALLDSTAACTTFETDAEGLYVIQLIVNDGEFDSDPDTCMVSASECATVGEDVTSMIRLRYSGMRFDRSRNITYVDLQVFDDKSSSTRITAPLRVVIDGITDPSIRIANADGVTCDGKPFIDFSDALGDGVLSYGEKSETKVLEFYTPDRVKFEWSWSARGNVEVRP